MAFPAVFHAALSDAIALMRVINGYSHDYGPVNAIRPSEWVLPQTFANYGDESLRATQRLGSFENNLQLTVRVICPAPVAPAVLQDVCDGIVVDFKRLLLTLERNPVLRSAGLIRADYVNAKTVYRLVAAAPAEVTLTYAIWYRQMRATI